MYLYQHAGLICLFVFSLVGSFRNPHSKPFVAALHRKSLVAVSEQDFHEGTPLWPPHTVNPMWLSVCEVSTREEGSSGCEGKGKTALMGNRTALMGNMHDCLMGAYQGTTEELPSNWVCNGQDGPNGWMGICPDGPWSYWVDL